MPAMNPHQVLALIAELFHTQGHIHDALHNGVGVNALDHALQCAQLAEWAHADPELVAAALLHDLGHLVDARSRCLGLRVESGTGLAEGHETRAMHLLRSAFGDEVTEPVRLHVQAKRYLIAFDRRYMEALSPASLHGLALQGGPLTPLEMRRFELEQHAGAAIKLRIWDDLAQHPGKSTPPLAHYLRLLESLVLQSERRAEAGARALYVA
jgi:predicted HD phosphohydrolase